MVDESTDHGNDVMESVSPVRDFLRDFNGNGC